MPHQNSVMHAVTQHLPWDDFDRLVVELETDADERGFTSKSHLMAMLFAQFSGAEALRDVEAGMAGHADRLYHLGVTPAVRTTLADANRNRDSRLSSGLFARLNRGQRRSLAETTYLLYATAIPLPGHAARWARFSATSCGVKMHVIYDAGAERPIYAVVTAANVNDITAANEMPIEAGATFVFDLGFYDFTWWSQLDEAQCRIVTRFKEEHGSAGCRGTRTARGQRHLVRPHRLSADAAELPAAEPDGGCGARGSSAYGNRQAAAHLQ